MNSFDFYERTRCVREGRVHGDQDGDHPLHYFWRVNGIYFWDVNGDLHTAINFQKWFILRRTPTAVWLVPGWASPAMSSGYRAMHAERTKKIAYLNTRKKWAYPTKAEAWDSYLLRQQRRLEHAKNNLEVARASLAFALQHDKEQTYG